MLLNLQFHIDFFPVFIVVAIAWLVPLLLNQLGLKRIPTVVVEILAGYVAGLFLKDFFTDTNGEVLDFLALSGFLFLMFSSGMEIDIRKLLRSLKKETLPAGDNIRGNPAVLGVLIFGFTLLLSYGFTFLLNIIVPVSNKWYFALILVTTSVGIILPVLKNRAELRTNYGQVLLTTAAVADILSILLFTFTAYIIRHGFKLEIFLILILFAAFFMFFRLGSRLNQLPIIRKVMYELSHAASQIRVRGTVLLILVFVVLGQFLGSEVILLGAFLSGVLLSAFINKDRDLLVQKLDGMGYGFFIPIFFVMVGITFDAGTLQEMNSDFMWFLLALLFTLFAVKIIPSLILIKMFGVRKSLAAGFLLSSRLSLIIAASAIGLELGIIDASTNSVFILMAVITCLASPILNNQINSVDTSREGQIVIVGGSSTGVLLARRLKMHQKDYVIVESDMHRYQEIRKKGLNVVLGDGLQSGVYNEINLTPESYVVVLTGSTESNYEVSYYLKSEFGHERIITKAYTLSMEQALNYLNVEFLDVRRVLATTLENLILRPTAYQTLVDSFENFTVEEMVVRSSQWKEKAIRMIPFHEKASVLLHKRGDITELPHGNTILKNGDKVFVFGTPTALKDTRTKISM
jgi:Kef-type K+ transport system membrane component KefB